MHEKRPGDVVGVGLVGAGHDGVNVGGAAPLQTDNPRDRSV
jgi:hypothetical protein